MSQKSQSEIKGQTEFKDQTKIKVESKDLPVQQKEGDTGKRYWIFQSKKERFDISDPNLLYKGMQGLWTSGQKRKEIQVNDIVFFWLTGDDDYKGVYAYGIVNGPAYDPLEEKKNEVYVDYECLGRFEPYISIDEIKSHPILKDLQILKNGRGSIFPVKVSEADALFELAGIQRGGGYYDPSKLHLDTDTDVDELGRKGFVDALAIWINRIWKKSNPKDEKKNISRDNKREENSFMIHLHGAWGSGKSTILNLLEKNLAGKNQDGNEKWLVVKFNAWQNSHVNPAWWPLLHQLYKDSRSQLKKSGGRWNALKLWWYDAWWKLLSGNKSTGIVFIAFLFLILIVMPGIEYLEKVPVINGLIVQAASFLNTIIPVGNIEDYKNTIVLLGSVISGGIYFFRSMIWGSAEAAVDYLKLHQDPLDRIKTYFRTIVEKVDRPIIIYVDDLDRCKPAYVVELLESIQTLFNNSRVFYLFAADRRWVYGSFNKNYGEFKDYIEEPGKHLGYLFLDKIFQLSVSVPKVTMQTQRLYLNYLYNGRSESEINEEKEKIKNAARQKMQEAHLNEVIDTVKDLPPDDPKTQIWKEEAVRASARQDIEEETEFFLLQFSHLLEPNPRSIKRLVNNYGVFRAIALLNDTELINSDDNRKKFALWNILKMRWPLLVEYLEDNPDKIEDICNLQNDIVDQISDKAIIKVIEKSSAFKNVMNGFQIDVSLDPDYVKKVLKLEDVEE